MKKYEYFFFLIFLFLFLFFCNIFSQSVILPTINAEKYCVKYKIGSSTFYNAGLWSIGRLDGSYDPGESTEDTYRSAWQYGKIKMKDQIIIG